MRAYRLASRLLESDDPKQDDLARKHGRNLEEMIRRHGPHGSSTRKDVSAAYARLGDLFRGSHAEWEQRVRRILRTDPGTTGAWPLLEDTFKRGVSRRRVRIRGRFWNQPVPSGSLIAFALSLVPDSRPATEAAGATQLLLAHIAHALGRTERAISVARALADAKTGSEQLRDDASSAADRWQDALFAAPGVLMPTQVPWRALGRLRSRIDGKSAEARVRDAAAVLGDRIQRAVRITLGDEFAVPLDVDPHAHTMAAWLRLGNGADTDWTQLQRSLRAKRTRLTVLDAIFDLQLSGKPVRAALEAALAQARERDARVIALRALALQSSPLAPTAITRYRTDSSWAVRLSYAEALRGYHHPDAVSAAIRLLDDKRRRVRTAAHETLRYLTGQEYGPSGKRWAAWFSETAKDAVVAKRPATRSPTRYYDEPVYYGLSVPSDHVVFVLDNSESMYWGLWRGAVVETTKFLRATGLGTSFAVVAFAERIDSWKKRLVRASKSNVRKARRYLQARTPYGPTNMIGALDFAMSFADCDSIVLLSDGLPNRGDMTEPNEIVAHVAKRTRYSRIVVHTVLMETGRSFPHDAPKDAEESPLSKAEKARRAAIRKRGEFSLLGRFLKELAVSTGGAFSVGFGDLREPPPDYVGRPSTDR